MPLLILVLLFYVYREELEQEVQHNGYTQLPKVLYVACHFRLVVNTSLMVVMLRY